MEYSLLAGLKCAAAWTFSCFFFLNTKTFYRTQKPKRLQEPNDNNNYNNNIENTFDFTIHRYIGVNKPEENTYNNQYN